MERRAAAVRQTAVRQTRQPPAARQGEATMSTELLTHPDVHIFLYAFLLVLGVYVVVMYTCWGTLSLSKVWVLSCFFFFFEFAAFKRTANTQQSAGSAASDPRTLCVWSATALRTPISRV